jgi:hypothetical protein
MSAAEEQMTPVPEDTEAVVGDNEEHFDEVAGYRVGHAGVPVVLVVLYLLIILWALVAWIPPKGTF